MKVSSCCIWLTLVYSLKFKGYVVCTMYQARWDIENPVHLDDPVVVVQYVCMEVCRYVWRVLVVCSGQYLLVVLFSVDIPCVFLSICLQQSVVPI